MKVSAIKKLLKFNIEELREAEELLAEEHEPQITVDGDDLGEKLTHVFGAIWIKEQLAKGEMDERTALRAFTQKVRGSIS